MNYIADEKQVSKYALMIATAFNAHEDNPDNLTAMPEEGTLLDEWIIHGHLVANNSIVGDLARFKDDDAFFGYLVQSREDPSHYVAVIRGTAKTIEWINNMKSNFITHADGESKVSNGFYSIYKSMELITPEGRYPAVEKIEDIVQENNGHITVTGHSLGGALATYLTYDLAQTSLDKKVNMVAFASPRAGDQKFVDNFEKTVNNYRSFSYTLDIVPKVPLSLFGYRPLKYTENITPENSQAVIHGDLRSYHHIGCYAASINYDSINYWKTKPTLRPGAHFINEAIISWDAMLVRNGCKPNSILGPKSSKVNIYKEPTLYDKVKDRVASTHATVLEGMSSFIAAGGFISLSKMATAGSAVLTNNISTFTKDKLGTIKRWKLQKDLDRDVKEIYSVPDKTEIDNLSKKLEEYVSRAKELYPPHSYTSLTRIEKEKRDRQLLQVQSSICHIEEIRAQKIMLFELHEVESSDNLTKNQLDNVLEYVQMLNHFSTSQISEIAQFRDVINNTLKKVVSTLHTDIQIGESGLFEVSYLELKKEYYSKLNKYIEDPEIKIEQINDSQLGFAL